MTHDLTDPDAQKKIIDCLEGYKDWYDFEQLHTFNIGQKEDLHLEEIFQCLGFFGSDNHVNPEKDGIFFSINVDEEPSLYYKRNANTIKNPIAATMNDNPKIGIILNRYTNKLDYFIWGGYVSGGIIRSDIDGSSNRGKYIELANCLVDIAERQVAVA